ncbi:ammonium transporter, partial [Sulfurovum lithotrophicum]
SVAVVGLWTLVGTVVVYFIASAVTGGGRVDAETEEMGLDETLHGERVVND